MVLFCCFYLLKKVIEFCFYPCYDCIMFNQTEGVMKAKLIDGLIAFAFGIVGTALILAVSIAYVIAVHPSTWR